MKKITLILVILSIFSMSSWGMGRRWGPPSPTPTPSPTATPTATPTPTPMPTTGIGLIYLAKSYAKDPPINPLTQGGVTNSRMKGSLWRETWDKLYKNGIDSPPDWTFLDACFSASNTKGKFAALEILAGNFAPPSFFKLPGAKHITTTAGEGAGMLCTIPWDPVFQARWETTQTAIAARYKNCHNSCLKYVKLIGPGHSSESFFATTPDEFTEATALAQSMGYTDLDEAWRAGVTWLIDMFVRVWAPIPVVLGTGTPYDRDGGTGQVALQAMFDYGDSTYPGKFGARADDLNASNPHSGDPSATIIQGISPHCVATGYQFGQAQNRSDPSPPAKLDSALKIGTGFGAHFIEVFASDADDPVSAPVLDTANVRMTGP